MEVNLDTVKNMKAPELDAKTKKMLKIGIIIIGLFVGLFVVMFIIKAIIGNKVSDEKLKTIMVSASKRYIEDNPDKIPTDVPSGEYEITLSNLVTSGYMREITKLKGKDTTCTGSVTVFYNNGNYSYSPRLSNCDSEDKIITIKDKLLESELVTTGSGLYFYEDTNEYVFRGESNHVDNYINFAGEIWRILSIDENGNVKMMQTASTKYVIWDNRYNADVKYNAGINYFEGQENSRIKDSLVNYYNTTNTLTSSLKSVIVPSQFCVGKRALKSTDKSSKDECLAKSEYLGYGLINASEVLRSSIDINCNKTNAAACSNYNFLSSITEQFWTITASKSNSYSAYKASYGTLVESNIYDATPMLAVTTINGNVEYQSGSGTQADPYVLKIRD